MIVINKTENRHVLRFETDLLVHNIDEVKYKLATMLKGLNEVSLDLSAVENCDAAGVQLLLVLSSKFKSDKKNLSLEKDSAAIKKAFSRLGLTTKLL